MLVALTKKETYRHYIKTLKFALYCMTHPLDGFWDLTHEKRGSLAAAHTILLLTLFAKVGKLQFTGFLFNKVYWPKVNIFLHLASVLFPLALWCIGNWALTTLFDGKGKLAQVYMATCYAFAPYPLIQIPMMVLSNYVTEDEGAFYTVFGSISVLWAGALILFGMMQIHEYNLRKTVLFTIGSIFAMMVMVFILLLFFSMISQGIAFVVSVVKEILFRM